MLLSHQPTSERLPLPRTKNQAEDEEQQRIDRKLDLSRRQARASQGVEQSLHAKLGVRTSGLDGKENGGAVFTAVRT